MIFVITLIFLSEIWDLSGQVLFKKSTERLHGTYFRNLFSFLKFISEVIRQPRIWAGLGCVAIGIIFWFLALSRADLSIAYPLDSMEYILTLVAARIFLKERIDAQKIIGTLLVVVGIIFITLS